MIRNAVWEGRAREVEVGMKIGRNQPCPCGGGKKFKNCCGGINAAPVSGLAAHAHIVRDILEQRRAAERMRERQQGAGRPIIGAKIGDFQMVAVGSSVHWKKDCKTFADFLQYYVKTKLGHEWGEAELQKSLGERHPILQWYDHYCRYQASQIKVPGVVTSSPVTGIVACYLGLAYGLYLLDHNVELQARLIRRLKDVRQFQGAYYEVYVARVLIRAGFTLELEDETDGSQKHCEFSATKDGKKYWVEAKMRSIVGMLGKTAMDGGSEAKPTKKLIEHLNAALAKPVQDGRLIFIDLNTGEGLDDPANVGWLDTAVARLERYEKDELVAGESPYLFVTNIAYHRQLDRAPTACVLPFGLGSDFERAGTLRIGDAWRRKQRHRHGYAILEAAMQDLRFPATFDGFLPSVAFHGSERLLIGNTYHFTDLGESGTVATVTAATVEEASGTAYIGIYTQKGSAEIITRRMTPEELADYAENRDSYFGRITSNGNKKQVSTPMEFFEWFMEANKGMSRANLLKHLEARPEDERLSSLSDEDLLVEYAERVVSLQMWKWPKAA